MNWQSYEETVKDIYEKLGESNIEILGWGPDCKVRGRSGVDHQIDVLTSHGDGIHSYRTAIECKFWSKKVSKDAITKLSGIIEDARIEKGVIVSKSGFTPDAVQFARYKNIGLVELREPVDEDWKDRTRAIHMNFIFRIPEVYDYEFIWGDIEGQGNGVPNLCPNLRYTYSHARWKFYIAPRINKQKTRKCFERRGSRGSFCAVSYRDHTVISDKRIRGAD